MKPTEVEREMSKAFYLKKEIRAKERTLEEMKTMATHITANFSPAKTFSSNISSKPENYAVNTYELTLDIEEAIQEFNKERKKIQSWIDMLNDPLTRAILTDYHINGIKLKYLEEIYHYSRTQIYIIRRNAYEKLASIL